MKTTSNFETTSALLEQPFPLKGLFRRRFIPALMGFIVIFLLLIGYAASQVVESIYLELAQRRAQTIARSVASQSPKAWEDLMSGHTESNINQATGMNELAIGFSDEVRKLNLSELKVYDLNMKVLFATHAEEIGTTEKGDALKAVINNTTSEIVTKTLSDGTRQYELYVPVFDDAGNLRTVFELYEPVGYLNAILINGVGPMMAIPAILLLLLAISLDRLVARAQSDIDTRTNLINELRSRIESFVSSTAINAAKSADHAGEIKSSNVTTTIFFSDIRDFTGFAEQNSPEAVVGFLNQLMTLQVNIIRQNGGDIDKMIGDAVLARFDSEDGNNEARTAALEILAAVKQEDYPRSLGIGVYHGEVISGAIGPENRRDFTVIGDAVNISARLCSAANAGEIVLEAELADDNFGPIELIQVKGRKKPVSIRRHKT